MKQGAIFDMDGLMFDTEALYGIAWTKTAESYGLTPNPDMHKAICGTSGERSLQIIRDFYPSVADAEEFLLRGLEWVRHEMANHIPEKPGVRELLAYLSEHGVRLAVASGTMRPYVERYLRRTGLDGYFSAVIGGTDIAHGKPEPDIFLAAAEALGLASEDCYVFEDGINGCLASIAAGCVTVMVPDLLPPTEFIRTHAAGIYPSLHEVRKALAHGEL